MKLAIAIAAISFLSAQSSDEHVPRWTVSTPGDDAEPLDAAFPADAILGEWWSEGKEGRLRIVKTTSGLYEVILVDGKDADSKDVNNPDPKLREQKLRGKVIMWHLRFVDGEYVDGYCYNPRDGNTYRVKMKILGPTSLRLRGYLAIPLLGQSQEWTRAK